MVVSVMANLNPAQIAVIGCGNPNRSDDGVGGEVIRRLAGRAAPNLRLLDAGTDGMAVMFAARGCKTLIVIDACTSGAAPGTLFEVPADEVAAPHPPSFTLHDFRWVHALYAGRRMFGADFPRDVTVLLVEARTLGIGLALSAEVDAAVTRTIARIEQLLAKRATP
jgi:hydrogenase maturation protease